MWRSWNIAASDDQLWQLQYTIFSNSDNFLKSKGHQIGRPVEDEEFGFLEEDMNTRSSIDWREAFKRAYIGMWIQNHLIYILAGYLFYFLW